MYGAEPAATTTDIVIAEGDFYPPYLCFMVTALMHSESLPDHEQLCIPLIDHAKKVSPDGLDQWWDYQREFEEEHLRVIRRFHRYPHRNKFKGRQSTDQELQWLSDTENLPAWAQSMG